MLLLLAAQTACHSNGVVVWLSTGLLWGVTSTTKSTVGNVGTYSSARPGGLALSLADVKVYSDSKTYVDNSK
jgi:hypothetical protein